MKSKGYIMENASILPVGILGFLISSVCYLSLPWFALRKAARKQKPITGRYLSRVLFSWERVSPNRSRSTTRGCTDCLPWALSIWSWASLTMKS